MITRSVKRGRTIILVTIERCPWSSTDGHDLDIVDHALAAAEETRSSVFGWNLQWFSDEPGVVLVTLHTD